MTLSPGDRIRTEGVTTDYREEFREVSTARWDAPVVTGSVVWGLDGNAAGARYLRVTLDPRDPTAAFEMTATRALRVGYPFRVGFGVTQSRRWSWSQSWFGLVGLDANGSPRTDTAPPASFALTGGIVITSNVATATTTVPHGLVVGQRVVIAGISDPRMRVLTTISGVPTPTTFTYAFTIGNGTYGTGGTATVLPASLGHHECLGVIIDDSTSGNAKSVIRTEGLSASVQAWNPGSSTAWDSSTIPNTVVNYSSAYTYPHLARYTVEMCHQGDWLSFTACPNDSSAIVTSSNIRDQNIPRPPGGFVPKVSVRNLPHMPVPIGPIIAAAKSGSTTTTLTIPNHGLTANDYITIVGVRNQTAFANQNTPVQVASVVDANTITVPVGTSTTATSYGGVVARAAVNTGATFASSAIQSIAASSGRLALTFATSQGTWTVGESVCVVGLVDEAGVARPEFEGLYRLASTNTTTFVAELEPLQGQALPTETINVGGTMTPATDFRLHYVRGQAHTRVGVEIESSRSTAKATSGVPVTVTSNIAPLGVNIQQVAGTTAASTLAADGSLRTVGVLGCSPASNNDKTSSAVTSTNNSGGISDNFGQVICGMVTVTAVSGSGATMDVELQESFDNGTTWHTVYALERVTANGTYRVPPVVITGRRRWLYTLAGSSPSFTFTITTMRSAFAGRTVRRFIDRALAPNTLNSTSAAYYIEGTPVLSLIVTSGAGASSNPTYGVQVSADGTAWADTGVSLVVPPSQTVAAAVATPFPAAWARVYIKAQGTSATHTSATLTAAS